MRERRAVRTHVSLVNTNHRHPLTHRIEICIKMQTWVWGCQRKALREEVGNYYVLMTAHSPERWPFVCSPSD